ADGEFHRRLCSQGAERRRALTFDLSPQKVTMRIESSRARFRSVPKAPTANPLCGLRASAVKSETAETRRAPRREPVRERGRVSFPRAFASEAAAAGLSDTAALRWFGPGRGGNYDAISLSTLHQSDSS